MPDNSSIPPLCFELLEVLADSDNERIPYRDLPSHLEDMNILEICRYRELITYSAWLENDPTIKWGGQLGSGTWARIVTKVKRETGTNDHKKYLHVELTGLGDRTVREQRLAAKVGGAQHDTSASARHSRNPPNDDVWLGSTEIAEREGVDPERLRKRLERRRAGDHNCYREIGDGERKRREPKYLYHVRAVRPIIEKLKTSDETSADRPAKKT